jgi:HSP20 family protein
VFSRQLFLGEALGTEHVSASYDVGVLTLRIPVAEQAKPRAPAGESNTMPARRDRRGQHRRRR